MSHARNYEAASIAYDLYPPERLRESVGLIKTMNGNICSCDGLGL